MRVLVVHAHPDPQSFNRTLCDTAVRVLRANGHEVDLIDLYAEQFVAAMTRAERVAYESDSPIQCDQVRKYAELIRSANALVFVYPTWWFGMPAVMKGWLERVMVPGVGFGLDPATNTVKPGLGQIRRIAGITTYGSSRRNMALMTDGGRRIIGRCIRMMVNLRCRRTWLALYGMDRATDADRRTFLARVETELGAW
jgi:NAD(P)H dehydrogenase (quinone)